MKFFKRFMLALRYKGELEQLLVRMRKEKEIAENEKAREYLLLCARHQPHFPGRSYAEHNCDHCKALRTIYTLEKIAERMEVVR
jgi:hypothetical protein